MKSESNVVVFDSCVLSAYLGLNPKESQEHIAAKTLVNDLVKKKYEIFIPVQAIQEVLICPGSSNGKSNGLLNHWL